MPSSCAEVKGWRHVLTRLAGLTPLLPRPEATASPACAVCGRPSSEAAPSPPTSPTGCTSPGSSVSTRTFDRPPALPPPEASPRGIAAADPKASLHRDVDASGVSPTHARAVGRSRAAFRFKRSLCRLLVHVVAVAGTGVLAQGRCRSQGGPEANHQAPTPGYPGLPRSRPHRLVFRRPKSRIHAPPVEVDAISPAG